MCTYNGGVLEMGPGIPPKNSLAISRGNLMTINHDPQLQCTRRVRALRMYTHM